MAREEISAKFQAAVARREAAVRAAKQVIAPSYEGDTAILSKYPFPKHYCYPQFVPTCSCGLHIQALGQQWFDYCKHGMDPADALVKLKQVYNKANILPLRDCCAAKIRWYIDNSEFQRNNTEWNRSSSFGLGLYARKLGQQTVAAPEEKRLEKRNEMEQAEKTKLQSEPSEPNAVVAAASIPPPRPDVLMETR